VRFNPAQLVWMIPLIVMAVSGMLLVLADAFYKGRDRTPLMMLTVAGSLGTLIASIVLYRQMAPGESHLYMSGMLVADRTSFVLIGLFAATTAAVALIAPAHQREHGWGDGEFYGILLLSTTGMIILAQANNLCSIFIGIETMSIGVYVLTASRRGSRRGNEAAMKYFLMGAFATAFLVYGMALIYGAAGTTDLGQIKLRIAEVGHSPLMIVGLFLVIVAFGFKIAAVPFHMWAPDAYEGAPTPVTAYMAAAVKAAAVASMLRMFGDAFGGDVMPFGSAGWASPMVVIAAITITVGNIAAVRQENVKRMLAYSSISHAGVLLVALAATGLGSQESGHAAVVFYLLAYSATTVGAFAVVAYIGSRDRERLHIDDWAGFGISNPAAALAMTICLLSLGGMPPTGGFFGKFYVFKAAMEAPDNQLLWLVAIGVVNSAISIFYYLRIVTAMYFKPATDTITTTRSAGLYVVMAASAVLVLAMGVLPGFWLGLGLP
jgi:NADH-quinone oxidoreductase subunit N